MKKNKETKKDKNIEVDEIQANQTNEINDIENTQENENKEQEKECCQEEKQALNDKYLRLFAEYENFRKRTLKEKEELYKTASIKVINALLPIIDDFDRAVEMIKKTEDINNIKEGMEIVYKKFNTVLSQQGVSQIETIGQKFDTDFHEAFSLVEVSKDKKDTVIEEIEKGYLLNGQVIRYAKVVVGK